VKWFLVAFLTQRLGTLDIQIDDNGILSAPDDHGFTRDVWAGIDFLVWDVGRNINEIAGFGFVAKL
jgi:hypothetical protein